MKDIEFKVKVVTGYNSSIWELDLLKELGIDRYEQYQMMKFTDNQLARMFMFHRLEMFGSEIKITIGAV